MSTAGSALPELSFDTHPTRWRHWSMEIDADAGVAHLRLDIDPEGGLRPNDYQLKLNSYDLGVDIELHDAVERLRLEHPEVAAVVVTSGLDRVFCSGANIPMLASSTHADKINFCKFTNETRISVEDASEHSGQTYVAAVNGTCAGGGYELALACDHIILVDDRSSAVSLPEVPLLGVLPGTGGLTRVVDKRRVRRDLADRFSTMAEGVMGETALDWKLVDELAARSSFDETVAERAAERAAANRSAGPERPTSGFDLDAVRGDAGPISVAIGADGDSLDTGFEGGDFVPMPGTAVITIAGPTEAPPDDLVAANGGWGLAAAHDLDRALIDLRFNHPEVSLIVLRTRGDAEIVAAWDEALAAETWATTELRLLWKRTLQRLEQSAKSLFTIVDPGSCYVGVLFELVLAADQSWMLSGTFEDWDEPPTPATVRVTEANVSGRYPMVSGLSRLASHFSGDADAIAAAATGDLDAVAAAEAGLVTSTPDDLDWDDEIRVAIEERVSFNPDALTGMEATLRFVGAENCDTKTLGRLTAWQNWIFHRANAAGPEGGLRSFGTGKRPKYEQLRT